MDGHADEQPSDDAQPPDWVLDRVPEEWEFEGPAIYRIRAAAVSRCVVGAAFMVIS